MIKTYRLSYFDDDKTPEMNRAPVPPFVLHNAKMATKTSKVGRLLLKHKSSLAKDADIDSIVSKLTHRGALNQKEEEVIFECADSKKKADIFVDIISDKGTRTFHEFCNVLEECAPHLLTRFLLDSGPGMYVDVIAELSYAEHKCSHNNQTSISRTSKLS